MHKRAAFQTLLGRIQGRRKFIQVIAGPRQVGKTTLVNQVMKACGLPSHYATADEPALKGLSWIEQQWEAGRLLAQRNAKGALLVLDELQKIHAWSETVKLHWDKDSLDGLALRVVLLGSSPLLIADGLSDSLAGRFEILYMPHWSYAEMRDAFGWDVDNYIFYGGYPGSAELVGEPRRWKNYVLDSLIETSLSRDILQMTRIDKPALMRRVFELACAYSGRILSYQKMIGQLQDAGNTTTIAHYLNLLGAAGLVTGIPKYAGQKVRQRASSPKLLVLNTALMSAQSHYGKNEAKAEPEFWGRLVETAVGASLANGAKGKDLDLFYWAAGNKELDFVLAGRRKLVAIEVKSGARPTSLPGIDAFSKEFRVDKKLLVGANGISLEDFLLTPPQEWVE